MVKLVVDSGCDLDEKTYTDLGIYSVPDALIIDKKVYSDGQLSPDELYQMLKDGKDTSTSAANEGDFLKPLEEILYEKNSGALVLTITSNHSAVYNNACRARENFPKEYHDKIVVIDSKSVSIGLGLMTLKVADYKLRCDDLDALAAYATNLTERTKLYAALDDYTQIRKSGRVPDTLKLLTYPASILNIHLILTIDNGVIKSCGRTRGVEKTGQEIAGLVEKDLETFQPSHVDIMMAYGQIEKNAVVLEDMLLEHLGKRGVRITHHGTRRIGSVIGSHAGSSAYGVSLIYNQ